MTFNKTIYTEREDFTVNGAPRVRLWRIISHGDARVKSDDVKQPHNLAYEGSLEMFYIWKSLDELTLKR